jgi:hypothetical protein
MAAIRSIIIPKKEDKPMYERMQSKDPPSEDDIQSTLGPASQCLHHLEDFLAASYDLTRELKYPFGRDYGWGYKYSHKASHLCYAFFETGAITVTLQLGDKLVHSVEAALPGLLPRTQELWARRYPCGTIGGWVHYRILDSSELNDVCKLISIKKRPKRTQQR